MTDHKAKTTDNSTWNQTMEELKTMRDELRVKADLAGKDLRDFMDTQESKFQAVQNKVRGATSEIEEHAPELKASFLKLVEEVKKTYEDTRSRLR